MDEIKIISMDAKEFEELRKEGRLPTADVVVGAGDDGYHLVTGTALNGEIKTMDTPEFSVMLWSVIGV